MAGSNKIVGSIPNKIEKALALIEDVDIHPVDIVADCGLSTIFAGSEGGSTQYDDEKHLTSITDLYVSQPLDETSSLLDNYKSVINAFVKFVDQKKTMLFIGDVLRHVFVQGVSKKTLSDKSKNFSNNIYWPIRHLTSTFNTSYGTMYANWGSVYDHVSKKHVWIPSSGIMSSIMAKSDESSTPWAAPAGFDRGVVNGLTDISTYYDQTERDNLYSISINTIANFPDDGFVVFGQKTLQTKPSAFDRVNVRRLFLHLEKITYQTVKYFVFEPNTYTTRSNVVNVLDPIFALARDSLVQGIHDYKIVCDKSNNSSDVIDSNELVVDIFIKPTRTAEFVLVNFYATRTNQSFSELVS